MTKAVSAKGIKLGVDINNVTYWFNEVKTVPEVGENPERIDVTHLGSDIREYINDIPDWSSTLDFTMNAQPFLGSPSNYAESNLNLIDTLSQTGTYKWTIVYPSLRRKVEIQGEWSWKMGGGAVSQAMEVTLTITPKSKPLWSELVTSCTLAYDANGGTGTMTDSSSPYNSGTTVTVKANAFTAPEGKTFGAWNTRADGSGAVYDESDTFVILEPTTLYAIWTDVETS